MHIVQGPAGAIMRYFAYSMKALDLIQLALQTEIAATSMSPPPSFQELPFTNSLNFI